MRRQKNMKKKITKFGGVGMPATLYLQEFGQIIEDVFGDCPYHVGSSLEKKKGWRDVDVRLILTDKEYEQWGFGDPERPHQNAKWRGLVKAFSLLGQQITGLPIDFQIQQMTIANKENQGYRSALFNLTRIQEYKKE